MRTIANDALGLSFPPAQQRLKFIFDLCLHRLFLLSIEICQTYVSEIQSVLFGLTLITKLQSSLSRILEGNAPEAVLLVQAKYTVT
jgi:hypothetical protein